MKSREKTILKNCSTSVDWNRF